MTTLKPKPKFEAVRSLTLTHLGRNYYLFVDGNHDLWYSMRENATAPENGPFRTIQKLSNHLRGAA